MTMTRMAQVAMVATASAIAISAAACSSQRLEPAAGVADQTRGTMASASGIEMRVALGSWKGGPEVSSYATPVFVSITNNSGQRIRVEPEQFRLMARNGAAHNTVSPSAIADKIQPYGAGYTMPADESSIGDLHLQALKGGVINEGETRTGFVFFEPASRAEQEWNLTARFESIDTGSTVATIAVPIRGD